MERLFDKTNPRAKRKITNFPDEIFVTIAGKKQNIRKMIAKNAENTGIYEQIELYGLNPIAKVEVSDIVEDYTQLAGDLRTAIERGQLAKEMFKNLPLEIRKEFNHDAEQFMREGPAWMEKKHKERLAQIQKEQEQLEQARQQSGTTGQGE